MNQNLFPRIVITLTVVLFATVFIIECASCGKNTPPPTPPAPPSPTFQASIWASERWEFLLYAPGGQDIRMNFPSGASDFRLEFYNDKDFKIKLNKLSYGKYEVGGNEQFVTLRPNDGKPTLNLEVNRDCKEEKLILELPEDESAAIFASLIIENNPSISGDMVSFLNGLNNGTNKVRLRFEFTRKAN